MLISEMIFTIITTLFFYLQTFWSDAGHSESYVTTIFAINAITAGVSALFASKVEQKIGKRWTLISVVILPTILAWLIATTPYSPFFYILFGPSEGLLIASIGTYLNKLIQSKQRATILSIQSMLFSLIMVAIFPSNWYHFFSLFSFLCFYHAFNCLYSLCSFCPFLHDSPIV